MYTSVDRHRRKQTQQCMQLNCVVYLLPREMTCNHLPSPQPLHLRRQDLCHTNLWYQSHPSSISATTAQGSYQDRNQGLGSMKKSDTIRARLLWSRQNNMRHVWHVRAKTMMVLLLKENLAEYSSGSTMTKARPGHAATFLTSKHVLCGRNSNRARDSTTRCEMNGTFAML